MSTVKIVYGDLDDARKAANKAADYCSDYAKELKKKVTNKISSLKGGSNSYTNSAAGYANKKISELNSKESKLRTFSGKIDTLVKEAKQTDKDVKKYLKAEGRDFRDSHGMHVNRVTELFVGFCVSVSNSNGFTKWIKDGFEDMGEWMDEKWEDFKYWYKCEGGKYVIKAIAAVVIVVVAVVAAIAAWPVMVAAISAGAIWGSIVAVAGFVGAVIAAADALVDLTYNIVAAAQFASDPAWAARYDSFNSVSGWLEKNRFGSGWMNRFSYSAAKIVNGIQAACAVVNLVNFAKNTGAFFQKWKSGTLWLKSPGAFKTIKNAEGISTWTKIKYALKSIKVDWGTFKSAFSANQFKTYVETYDSLGKALKTYLNGTSTLKTIAKIVINIDEKGIIKSTYDVWKSSSPITQTKKSIESITSNWSDLQYTIKSTYKHIVIRPMFGLPLVGVGL